MGGVSFVGGVRVIDNKGVGKVACGKKKQMQLFIKVH